MCLASLQQDTIAHVGGNIHYLYFDLDYLSSLQGYSNTA